MLASFKKCQASIRPRGNFIERTIRRLANAMEHAARAEDSIAGSGFLQQIDPRVKLGGIVLLIVAVVASQRIGLIIGIFGLGVVMAFASGVAVLRAIARLWAGILFFTGMIVLPSLFTIHGEPLWQLPWIGWTVTVPGLQSAVHLIARAETTATLATLMVFTTRWPHLLKALRVLRVPAVFVVILGMTYRYIFLLLQIAQSYFEARNARLVGKLSGVQRRQLAVSSAAVLLTRSVQLSSESYEAMLARGFRGTVYTLDEFRMKPLDWLVLIAFLLLAGTAFWMRVP